MSERSDGGKGGDGVGWTAAFDPVANARALEQIQRRGLQAAGEIVNRLVSVVDGAREHGVSSNGSDLLGVWADLVTQTLQAMARLSVPDVPDVGPPPQPTGGPVWVDVSSGRASGIFALDADPADGARAAPGELWLHNPSGHALGPLRLHVGELRSPEGQTVPSGSIHLDPETLRELPARSSRGVSASVASPSPLVSGRYRGLLQIDGADDVAVSVELTVPERA
ncbi:MAG: hypothetical protein ACXV9P_03740 [Acidimicrobiia bacterium]